MRSVNGSLREARCLNRTACPESIAANRIPSTIPAERLWWEQGGIVRAGLSEKIDVLHCPYWSNPLWDPWPTVVTIHDVIQFVLPQYRWRKVSRLYFSVVSRAACSGGCPANFTLSSSGKSAAAVDATLAGSNSSGKRGRRS